MIHNIIIGKLHFTDCQQFTCLICFRFFGSRFDNLQNLVGAGNLSENSSVVQALTSLATLIANAVFNISQPSADSSVRNISANSTLIKNVLECFLKNTSCTLFQTILHPQLAATLRKLLHMYYMTISMHGCSYIVFFFAHVYSRTNSFESLYNCGYSVEFRN